LVAGLDFEVDCVKVAHTDAKEASIEAVVIRADGSRENLGTIAYWHRNPVRRLWWHAKRKLKG
jgi:hypothetical protein